MDLAQCPQCMRQQTLLQGEEIVFYSAIKVSIMVWGDDGVINVHEDINWLTGKWDVTCDKWWWGTVAD